MIHDWDIISSMPSAGAGHITNVLVMNGTQEDARLVVRKLKQYIRSNPAPANPPYIYAFELPADLDEGSIEDIRAIMREGVNEAAAQHLSVPGGAFDNPVFDTFTLTQAPGNHAAGGPSSRPAKPNPTASFGPKTIDLADTGLLIAKTVPPQPPATVPPLPPAEKPISETTEQHRKRWVSTKTLNELFNTNTFNGITQPPLPTQPSMPTAPTAPDALSIPPETTVHELTIQEPFQQDTPETDTPHQPELEDIFLAETKYDIFVDIAKDAPQNKTTEALQKPPKTPKKITPDTPINIPPSPQATTQHTLFNVFDQETKDISDITQSITEKDFSFAKQVDPKTELTKTENVMDPFEQLLAGEVKPSPAPTKPAPASAKPIVKKVPPPATPAQPSLKKKVASPDLQSNKAEKKTEDRVVPVPTANMERNMNQNEAEKRTFIHLKRKAQPPQAPAVPQPPKPAIPRPPLPAAPKMPAPQPERHRTIVRKNNLSKTFLERTATIDHSIELPLSELKKHNWPLEVPLIPTYTLDNMIISVNRFAHANAISVIENPGRLYNPLVLHGPSGTGKTHFLHAVGYALSKKYGQENIFITNGVRLSRGIQRYIMEGNIAKFEEFTSSVKALLIDDIHLISVNEQNRMHLSKLLNDFMAQQKQIVITSKYPPENLAKLEELLNFKLDSGWISDLKPAHGPARMRIIQNMLASNGINITNEEVNRFFGHANMSLGTVVRSIRRVRVLEKLMFQNTGTEKPDAVTIFDQLLATKGEDQSSLIAQKSINDVQSVSIQGDGEWGRIGFFYPQNQSNMMNWLLFALQQRAKELKIPGGPELAVRSSYSTENIISSAFKIANLCDNKKLKGAVILGPNINNCEPSVRENFYDILTHMLEIMLIRCGVINFEDAAAPSTYVKMLAELLR